MKWETRQLKKKDIRANYKLKVDIRKCAKCERHGIALNKKGLCLKCGYPI